MLHRDYNNRSSSSRIMLYCSSGTRIRIYIKSFIRVRLTVATTPIRDTPTLVLTQTKGLRGLVYRGVVVLFIGKTAIQARCRAGRHTMIVCVLCRAHLRSLASAGGSTRARIGHILRKTVLYCIARYIFVLHVIDSTSVPDEVTKPSWQIK